MCAIGCVEARSWLDVLKVLSTNSEVVFSNVLRVANSATDSLAKDVFSRGRSFDLWVMVKLMQLLYLFLSFLV